MHQKLPQDRVPEVHWDLALREQGVPVLQKVPEGFKGDPIERFEMAQAANQHWPSPLCVLVQQQSYYHDSLKRLPPLPRTTFYASDN